jgi:hypothetical protein
MRKNELARLQSVFPHGDRETVAALSPPFRARLSRLLSRAEVYLIFMPG